MPISHTRIEVHGIQFDGPKSSTFILGFRWVGYKQVTHNTFQNFVGVHNDIQKKFNEHIVFFFLFSKA